jgi:hypothetical protein
VTNITKARRADNCMSYRHCIASLSRCSRHCASHDYCCYFAGSILHMQIQGPDSLSDLKEIGCKSCDYLIPTGW